MLGALAPDHDRPDAAHRERGARAHRGPARRGRRAPAPPRAALRASEQRFRNILDNVPIGVVYTDLAGRVIQANPRYCELTGYDERELTRSAPRR